MFVACQQENGERAKDFAELDNAHDESAELDAEGARSSHGHQHELSGLNRCGDSVEDVAKFVG